MHPLPEVGDYIDYLGPGYIDRYIITSIVPNTDKNRTLIHFMLVKDSSKHSWGYSTYVFAMSAASELKWRTVKGIPKVLNKDYIGHVIIEYMMRQRK